MLFLFSIRKCNVIGKRHNTLYQITRRTFSSRDHVGTTKTESVMSVPKEIKNHPRYMNEMSNNSIILLARMGDQEAREERLIREIMRVDDVEWEDAHMRFQGIVATNRRGMWLARLPYSVGLITSVVSAIVSIPLVFHYDTILWFNEHYVTTDVPEPKDLETWLECGAWSWNWMEPSLGTISFVLLALRFGRAQLSNLNAQPYTEWMKARRSQRLCEAYPQYNPTIVKDFSRDD